MDLSKLSPEFVADVQHLGKTREEIAGKTRQLALRELEARILRMEIEARLRDGVKDAEGAWVVTPLGKTEAEKVAKADESYLAFERETARIAYDRDLAVAEAEGIRLELQAFIMLQGVA